jgi:hypothetical protein
MLLGKIRGWRKLQKQVRDEQEYIMRHPALGAMVLPENILACS